MPQSLTSDLQVKASVSHYQSQVPWVVTAYQYLGKSRLHVSGVQLVLEISSNSYRKGTGALSSSLPWSFYSLASPATPPHPNLWKLLDRFLIRIRAHRVIPWHTHTPPNTLSIRKIWTDISRACNTSRNLEEKRHSSGLKTKWLHEYRARSEIDFYNLTQEGLLAPCQHHTDHSHTSRSPVTIRVSRGNPF